MRWTVGKKIGAGFALALLIQVVIGTGAFVSIQNQTDTAQWVTHTYRVQALLQSLVGSLSEAETSQRGFILTGQPSYKASFLKAIEGTTKDLETAKFETKDNPDQQITLDDLRGEIDERIALLTTGIEKREMLGADLARDWIIEGQGQTQMNRVLALVGEAQAREQGLLEKRTKTAQLGARATNIMIVGGTAGAAVLLLLIGVAIARNIATPLAQLTQSAERIAAGDLNVTVGVAPREDEVGTLASMFSRMVSSLRVMAEIADKIAQGDLRVQVAPQSDQDMLGNSFTSMVTNLQQLTGRIAEGVQILSTSANQISSSTTQLAASATQTATAVAETTTTVEEVRQTAQVASQKSRQVSDSAQRVAVTAATGRKSTEETIEGMQRIRQQMDSIADSMVRLSEQTQAIGQIIATVDDLSAQSNLLAVNAAIEAAKAGEHGKGFAVVAQEVRSLAEQSKQATSQVRGILHDIQKATGAAVLATEQGTKAVELGVRQSSEAGKSIHELSASVNEAAQAATQIAASGQQQLVGVDQVASAIESIKNASAQNVASARQLESAAHGLKELGQNLRTLIERYRI